MKLNTKRNILSDFSGKLNGNLKKNKNQGTSILSDFKLTGSLTGRPLPFGVEVVNRFTVAAPAEEEWVLIDTPP